MVNSNQKQLATWILARPLWSRVEGQLGPEIALQLLVIEPDARYNLCTEIALYVVLIYNLPLHHETPLRCSEDVLKHATSGHMVVKCGSLT